jgi:hypothetical protein
MTPAGELAAALGFSPALHDGVVSIMANEAIKTITKILLVFFIS